jgi:hypothetical protein
MAEDVFGVIKREFLDAGPLTAHERRVLALAGA